MVTENCRRVTMLEGIGSSEHVTRDICCDVCTEGVPYPRLAILGRSTSTSRKRRAAKHDLAKNYLQRDCKRSVIKSFNSTQRFAC